MTCRYVANVHGNHRSSLSRKTTYSPVACWMPRFLAAPCPWFRWCNTRTRSPYRASTAGVSSVEPSSTTSTSEPVNLLMEPAVVLAEEGQARAPQLHADLVRARRRGGPERAARQVGDDGVRAEGHL